MMDIFIHRYDWLKLEDVRASLFIAAVRRRVREARKLGEKVPAWLKFFQVRWLPVGARYLEDT